MCPAPRRATFRQANAGVAVALTLTGAGVILEGQTGFSRHKMPPPEMVAASLTLDGHRRIFVQVHETTVAEWNLCYRDKGCRLGLRPPVGADPGDFPATGINWIDAQDYVRWLSEKTGHPFRLPTSGEWYELARDVLPDTPDPMFSDPSLSWASAYQLSDGPDRRLRPVGAWSTTAEGIADFDGNVWEWTSDCYDGERTTSPDRPCAAYVLGGEHRSVVSFLVRDPARGGCAVGAPPAHLGLRPVTDTRPLR